ncbi:MAG: hypothetical protein WC431_00415 [Candidatus Omnitrophota bacterium]|jgi:hypothetical protein
MKKITKVQSLGIGFCSLASLFVAGWGMASESSKIVLYAIWFSVFGIFQLLIAFASIYLEE